MKLYVHIYGHSRNCFDSWDIIMLSNILEYILNTPPLKQSVFLHTKKEIKLCKVGIKGKVLSGNRHLIPFVDLSLEFFFFVKSA